MAETTGVTIKAEKIAGLDTDASMAACSDEKIPSQKAVKAYVDAAVAGVGGSGSIARRAPTGAIDGVNTSFSFSPAPGSAAAFFLVWNGLIVDPASYSLSGGTLTTTAFIPQSGDSFYAIF